jgi:hypothetical protein
MGVRAQNQTGLRAYTLSQPKIQKRREFMKKKTYQRPELRRYGTVEQITLRATCCGADSAGSNRRPTNAYSGWF